jgi:oligoribonuclease (3'-5' exoribonuclease)
LLDSVQRPVSCFITFENEEGKSRADEYNEIVESIEEFEHYRDLLGEPIKID